MLAPHERIEVRDAAGRLVCWRPDYTRPYMAERVRREVLAGEIDALPTLNSSNMLYLLRTEKPMPTQHTYTYLQSTRGRARLRRDDGQVVHVSRKRLDELHDKGLLKFSENDQ